MGDEGEDHAGSPIPTDQVAVPLFLNGWSNPTIAGTQTQRTLRNVLSLEALPPGTSDPILYLAQLADGGGIGSEILLMNFADRLETGTAEFRSSDGTPFWWSFRAPVCFLVIRDCFRSGSGRC